MSDILDAVITLTRPGQRLAASATLAAQLGGSGLMVFVRDEAVDTLVPAPVYPQTLPDMRTWRRFLEECVTVGEAEVDALQLPDGDAVPAFGFSSGEDVVAVVLGTRERHAELETVRQLLPLFAATVRGERAAGVAEAHARMARESAAHAESLARALDSVRGQLQRALIDAEHAREELEQTNVHLQDQALEMEAQAEELELQAEELQGANAELERARREAEEANRAKSDFLATMSHELRTPLNAIGGHVQLVQLGIYGDLTDGQRTALGRIDRSQRHLLGIINDILNLARIESGHVEYHRERVLLAEAVADLEAMIQPQIEAKAMRYDVRIEDPELAVIADREKVQQVLLNLLSNAVKFTGTNGAISVEALACTDRPGTAAIRVTDTGVGIPAGRTTAIFEPFVQVDSSHSRGGQGTGLGLAISRDLARAMGGDLTVESEPGEGSTFTLLLPLDAEQSASPGRVAPGESSVDVSH